MPDKSSAAARALQPPLWRTAMHALQGKRHDYTVESLDRALLLLAIPMMLEMVSESVFAVVDTFWVSRLGAGAIAVVGLTEAAMSLVYAFAIGMSFVATAMVARRVGHGGDVAGAAQAAGQCLIAGLLVSSVLALLAFAAPQILRGMGGDAAVADLGAGFARVMLAGNASVFLMFLINAVFRGAGDAAIAMRALWLANGINVLLAPCLIFGLGPFPQWGVTGAAVATTASRALGVAYQLAHLTGAGSRVRVRWANLRPEPAQLRAILRIGASGIAQMAISTTSAIGLFAIAAQSGTTALAGCTIALRVAQFVLLPAFGLARAGATLVGQNLGAGNADRAERAVRIALRADVVLLLLLGAALFAAATPIAALFTADEAVLHEATLALRIVTLAFPCYGAAMCLQSAFNGAGDTWTPARLNFLCFWLLQVPLAWALAVPLGWGALGVYASVPFSFALLLALSAALFRRGRWKTHAI